MLYLTLAYPLYAQMGNGKVMTGQEVEQHWRTKQELGDIYKRAAASRFVVIGTVVGRDIISERGVRPSIDENIGGILYKIQVQDTVCRQEEFDPLARDIPGTGLATAQMFVPVKPYVEGIQRKENLTVGERYLLFLAVPPPKEVENWKTLFMLNAEGTYFRGEELSRGVILLPRPTAKDPTPKEPELLGKVTQLCQALAQKEPTDRILALNRLAASPDPILQREAQEAINAMQVTYK
jgi:hypothetical protein